MSQGLERYKTLCVAQEAEIARLKNGLDDLRNRANLLINQRKDMFDGYSNGKVFALKQVLTVLDRITGEKE